VPESINESGHTTAPDPIWRKNWREVATSVHLGNGHYMEKATVKLVIMMQWFTKCHDTHNNSLLLPANKIYTLLTVFRKQLLLTKKSAESQHLMHSDINVHTYVVNQVVRLNQTVHTDQHLLYLSFSYIITKVFIPSHQIG